jgi:hypothetical protein
MMRDYLPQEVTHQAHEIARGQPSQRVIETSRSLNESAMIPRVPLSESFDPSRGKRDVKIDVKEKDLILFGRDRIDLRAVEQLVDMSQTRGVGHGVHLAATRFMDGRATLAEVVGKVVELFDREGLDILDPFHRPGRHPGNYARPRKHEMAAAMNRLRTVRMRQNKP